MEVIMLFSFKIYFTNKFGLVVFCISLYAYMRITVNELYLLINVSEYW